MLSTTRYFNKKLTRINQQRRPYSINVINPVNSTLIKTLQSDTIESLSKKHGIASTEGKVRIQNLSLRERCQNMSKFIKLLEDNEQSLAETLTNEMGKPIQQSLNEIKATRIRVQWFIDHVEESIKDDIVKEKDGFKEKISREPLGTIANISAWNYPYFVGVNVIVPALLTGNSVLYKPSEFSSMTGIRMVDMLQEVGFDKSIQSIIGGGDIGRALLDLDIQGVFFTGSYATGRKINETVASKLIKVQLELGGKDPVYVHDDVDVDSVAQALVDGAMYNAGQSCCSVERIYIHENIYPAFEQAFIRYTKALKVGNPLEKDTDVGPLARSEQIPILEDQIWDAVSKGAVVQCGGTKVTGEGNFFQPTVLTNVNHTMKIMTEESFGPIIGLMPVASPEEALMFMNDTSYGLTSAVYSKDEEVASQVMKNLNSGTVYWNRCDSVSNHLPWSGRKNSGIGLTLSKEGITAFTNPKAYNMKW